MILRLLLSFAIVAVVAFIFFHLGKWEERRNERDRKRRAEVERQLLDMERRHEEERQEIELWASVCRTAAEMVQGDTAAMMREMEFFGEAAERVNCRTHGSG